MKKVIFSALFGGLGDLIGRKNLVRIGGFLQRAGRMDAPNELLQNGEVLVQEVVIKHSCDHGLVVIDCGANEGQWVTQFLGRLPECGLREAVNIYCFEPSLYTMGKLKNTLCNISKTAVSIMPEKLALSDRIGNGILKVVHDGAGTNSLIGMPGTYTQTENVNVTTLDHYAEEADLSHIVFLKIDAEGHDADVIAGAKQLLSRLDIEVVQFEYNARWIYGHHFLRDIFELLNGFGYQIGKITPRGIQFYPEYHHELETFIEANFIACTPIWKDRFPKTRYWRQ